MHRVPWSQRHRGMEYEFSDATTREGNRVHVMPPLPPPTSSPPTRESGMPSPSSTADSDMEWNEGYARYFLLAHTHNDTPDGFYFADMSRNDQRPDCNALLQKLYSLKGDYEGFFRIQENVIMSNFHWEPELGSEIRNWLWKVIWTGNRWTPVDPKPCTALMLQTYGDVLNTDDEYDSDQSDQSNIGAQSNLSGRSTPIQSLVESPDTVTLH